MLSQGLEVRIAGRPEPRFLPRVALLQKEGKTDRRCKACHCGVWRELTGRATAACGQRVVCGRYLWATKMTLTLKHLFTACQQLTFPLGGEMLNRAGDQHGIGLLQLFLVGWGVAQRVRHLHDMGVGQHTQGPVVSGGQRRKKLRPRIT
jgi:hypothetical protein